MVRDSRFDVEPRAAIGNVGQADLAWKHCRLNADFRCTLRTQARTCSSIS
jgi:hypothetical protein